MSDLRTQKPVASLPDWTGDGFGGVHDAQDIAQRASRERLFDEFYQNKSNFERHTSDRLHPGRHIPQTRTGDTFAINIQNHPDFAKQINGRRPDWYEIDLDETSKSNLRDARSGSVTNPIVNGLRERGILPVAYINGGAWQPGQSDSNQFPESLKGRSLGGDYKSERWLDIRNIDAPGNKLAQILRHRMDRAKAMGFAAIDVDNVDGWDNNTGKNISYGDGLKFNMWLAKEAHERGLAIFLKNNGKQARELAPYFDGAVTEGALRPGDGDPPTDSYRAFTSHNKAVFDIEYKPTSEQTRRIAASLGYTVVRENKHLDGSFSA